MLSKDKAEESAMITAATFMSAVELVSRTIDYLSGRDLSGETPNGNLRDDFGREIIAGRIISEIQSRVGVRK